MALLVVALAVVMELLLVQPLASALNAGWLQDLLQRLWAMQLLLMRPTHC